MEKIIKLKVKEALEKDIKRSIIRLDSEVMKELDVKTQDLIEIKGNNRVTAAKVWPAYPQDQGLGIVRMDNQVRQNANVNIDDFIMITKIKECATNKLTIAPVSLNLTPNVHFQSFVKRKLLDLPIAKDDLIHIYIGITKEIIFRVVALEPAGISVVKQNTQLLIKEISTKELPNQIPFKRKFKFSQQ